MPVVVVVGGEFEGKKVKKGVSCEESQKRAASSSFVVRPSPIVVIASVPFNASAALHPLLSRAFQRHESLLNVML